MSTYKFDQHTKCTSCRGSTCDLENRCEECSQWSNDAMISYVKHQKSLLNKGPKRPSTSAGSASSSTSKKIIKDVESRITANVNIALSDVYAKLDAIQQDRSNNDNSFAAPGEVPDSLPGMGSTGGDVGPHKGNTLDPYGSPGMVLHRNKDPPHPISVFCTCIFFYV